MAEGGGGGVGRGGGGRRRTSKLPVRHGDRGGGVRARVSDGGHSNDAARPLRGCGGRARRSARLGSRSGFSRGADLRGAVKICGPGTARAKIPEFARNKTCRRCFGSARRRVGRFVTGPVRRHRRGRSRSPFASRSLPAPSRARPVRRRRLEGARALDRSPASLDHHQFSEVSFS